MGRPEKLYAGEPDFDAVAQRAIGIGLGHVVSRVDLNILVAVALESMESDPVAVVRSGVESGTIEGKIVDWLDPDREGHMRRVLIIPVSDGGEDTE